CLVQALRRSKTLTPAVKLSLGCIADDYTGASDLANTLTRCGLRTVQTIGVPRDDLALPEVDAVVVSLKSRSIEAGLAVARSRAAEKWLRGRGASHVLFKICSTFDSTDAGNIGPVMDAVRARLADLASQGIGAAIVDAVFDPDLETIGKVALDHRVSVGASGIGLGLARALVISGKARANAATAISDAPVGGPAACLAGSCSHATLGQIANAERVMPVLHLDADRVVAGKEEGLRALAWAKQP